MWPISLLCCDYKILTKALAARLEPTMITHRDQTGFMTGRQLAGDLRRLFNIIYTPNYTDTREVIISLDAQKAFDRVEYNYLFAALKRFGFGQKFCSWVNLLYSNPQASVRTNNFISDYFPISRGTRQRCPLSPLLFSIAVEPLAVSLRENAGLLGVERFVSFSFCTFQTQIRPYLLH